MDAIIRDGCADGRTMTAIADNLGLHRNSVRLRAEKLCCLPRRPAESGAVDHCAWVLVDETRCNQPVVQGSARWCAKHDPLWR